jgi:hypothetical protein
MGKTLLEWWSKWCEGVIENARRDGPAAPNFAIRITRID